MDWSYQIPGMTVRGSIIFLIRQRRKKLCYSRLTACGSSLGWVLVFAGLVILNEIERRTKLGGYGIFVGVLAILLYTLSLFRSAPQMVAGVQPMIPMYIWVAGSIMQKLYAAAFGCIGFMFLKYKQWIGKTDWFKVLAVCNRCNQHHDRSCF